MKELKNRSQINMEEDEQFNRFAGCMCLFGIVIVMIFLIAAFILVSTLN